MNIPKGSTAHQNKLSRLYYIRRNATIEVMEDYEIRDVMNRQNNPPLKIEGFGLYKTKHDKYDKCGKQLMLLFIRQSYCYGICTMANVSERV